MEPRRLPLPEFVALMALLFAMVAGSIDSMLPAFPRITAELTAEAPNRVQLILSFFILGMGTGTFFTGPLSDAFGRKRVITAGMLVYMIGAVLAWRAPTLDTLLAARALQGLGAAAPRVVGTAMIRDLYQGRKMAQITSFVMTVFMIIPALAPSLGALVIAGFGWRGDLPGLPDPGAGRRPVAEPATGRDPAAPTSAGRSPCRRWRWACAKWRRTGWW